MLTGFGHLVLGLWTLLAMGVRTRFRMGSAYWRWRRATAIGEGGVCPPPGRVRSVLHYARWVGSMRTLRR